MQTQYKSRPVRSPFQPRQSHPVKQAQERSLDMSNEQNPVRLILAKLCQAQYNLCATFSPDTGTMAALKTPGLVAVKCELSLDGKPIGLGHGSTAISRLNKGLDRALFGCLNGALMSAINVSCKSLDVMRLGDAQELGEAYKADSGESTPATLRQLEYLKQLLQVNADEQVRDKWMPNLDTLTKSEASELIQQYATK